MLRVHQQAFRILSCAKQPLPFNPAFRYATPGPMPKTYALLHQASSYATTAKKSPAGTKDVKTLKKSISKTVKKKTSTTKKGLESASLQQLIKLKETAEKKKLRSQLAELRKQASEFPSKPKGATPPTTRFYNDMISQGKATTHSFGDNAALWRKLDAGTREKYSLEYKEDALRYSKELRQWRESLGAEQKGVLRKITLKKRALLNKPKRKGKKMPFLIFFSEKSKERNPDIKITEWAKEVGKMWREMNEKEKTAYAAKADNLNAAR